MPSLQGGAHRKETRDGAVQPRTQRSIRQCAGYLGLAGNNDQCVNCFLKFCDVLADHPIPLPHMANNAGLPQKEPGGHRGSSLR